VHKKHRRLYDAREAAVKTLQKEIDKRKKKLLTTVEFDLPTRASRKPAKAKAKKKVAKRS
jgi:hypothetical protein